MPRYYQWDKDLFIRNILDLMERRGFRSQKEFEAEIGQLRAITRWKTGESRPQLDALLKIKSVLDCSIDWLLTGEKPEGRELTDDEIALITAVREAPEIIPSLIRLIYSIIEKREYRPACHTENRLKVAEPGPRYRTKRKNE